MLDAANTNPPLPHILGGVALVYNAECLLTLGLINCGNGKRLLDGCAYIETVCVRVRYFNWNFVCAPRIAKVDATVYPMS